MDSEIVENIKDSLSTLGVNKLRTSLAILGIVIGIGSVIALISLGQSTQQAVQNQIQSLGANLLTVIPGSQNSGGVRSAQGSATTLTNQDAAAILTSTSVTTIKSVSPEVSGRSQLTAGRNNTNVQVIGTTPSYATVHKINISVGNFIAERDNTSLSRVIVLGPQVVEDLFGSASPIGQSVRIENNSFKVIGVTEAKGGTGFQNPDNIAYIPLSTAQKIVMGQQNLSTIALEANSQDVMTLAQNQVGYLLLARHKINSPQDADFMIFSQQDIINAASQTTGTFTTLLSGIAAISLIVGGIGIMNIMLVTVTERTREIGLRKALGAKKGTIIQQFLIESVLLTFTGGLLGIVLGVTLTFLYSKVTSTLFVVSPFSVILAFVVSGGIGILFGWYPSQKAAKLEPIEALRYE